MEVILDCINFMELVIISTRKYRDLFIFIQHYWDLGQVFNLIYSLININYSRDKEKWTILFVFQCRDNYSSNNVI